jgi:hypothetical protein
MLETMLEYCLNEWGIGIRDYRGNFLPVDEVAEEFAQLCDLQDHMGRVALFASLIMAHQSDETYPLLERFQPSPDLYETLLQVCQDKLKRQEDRL